MKNCSINGCDRPMKSRGMCTGHYERWRRHGVIGGELLRYGAPLETLEMIVTKRRAQKSCFLWPHAKTTAGYGTVGIDGKTNLVHRVVCERVHGPPPTPKHQAAHSCGNGHLGCATPLHLRWATPKENTADMIAHGRGFWQR